MVDSSTLLVEQARIVNGRLHALAKRVTQEEWFWRPGEDENLVGFTLWHIPATQDWGLRTWLRNMDDLRQAPEWRELLAADTFTPFGMPLSEADAVAKKTSVSDVLAYADAVMEEFTGWVGSLTDEELDHLPETHRHQERHPAYRGAAYVEEIEGMRKQRSWRLISGACLGHPMRHLGEVETLLGMRRRAVTEPS